MVLSALFVLVLGAMFVGATWWQTHPSKDELMTTWTGVPAKVIRVILRTTGVAGGLVCLGYSIYLLTRLTPAHARSVIAHDPDPGRGR